MAGATVDPATMARVEQAAETVLRNWQDFVAGHPEVTTIKPPFLGGWAFLIAQGAYFLGDIATQPQLPDQERLALEIQYDLNYLKQGTVATAPLGQTLRHLNALLRLWEQRYGGEAPGDPSTGVPSPNAVARAQGQALANAVARLTAWEKAHHGKVHVPLTVAETAETAGVHAFTEAVGDLGAATAAGLKAIVNHYLPELRHQVVELIREERGLRRDADQELRERLVERTQVLTQRIGDVVRWLRTEVIPETRELVRTETQARKATDRELRTGLATVTNTVEAELPQLALQLAPLTSWMNRIGLHTTEKVHRNEELIDQLGGADWSQLLALSTFPGLAALTTELLVRLVPQVPTVVGGLEEAAFRALGAVR